VQHAHVERLARAFGADGELQVEWPWAAEATSRSSFDLSGSCDLTCRPSEPGSVHKTTGWMRGVDQHPCPRRYPPELRKRAVRLVLDTVDAEDSSVGESHG
jgi:hypothetical protein